MELYLHIQASLKPISFELFRVVPLSPVRSLDVKDLEYFMTLLNSRLLLFPDQ